jgi:hypothetical protein
MWPNGSKYINTTLFKGKRKYKLVTFLCIMKMQPEHDAHVKEGILACVPW